MTRILPALAGLAVAFAPHWAAAKFSCYPLKQIEQTLHAEYGEKPHFTGRESEGIEYRLYVNADTGSWSWIGIPVGSDLACLIFAGRTPRGPTAAPSRQSAPEAQF